VPEFQDLPMRLGQLARKLGTSTSEIVQFLGSQNIPIEDGINTRIEDLLVTTVVKKFAPDRLAEFTAAPEVVVEPVEEVVSVAEPIVEPTPEVTDVPVTETPVVEPQDPAFDPSKIEVIKASKVELSGLKVLGKIDLPEPKKKEEPKPEATEASAPLEDAAPIERPQRYPRDQRRDSRRNQSNQNRQPRKNPIALQREREEQEAKKKREEQIKLEKERKAKHYYKNVKVAAPTKAAKLLREQVEEMAPVEERPKTFWGRLKKWFTT
jgi:hypothetical protein